MNISKTTLILKKALLSILFHVNRLKTILIRDQNGYNGTCCVYRYI
jgi:hypothetical protein